MPALVASPAQSTPPQPQTTPLPCAVSLPCAALQCKRTATFLPEVAAEQGWSQRQCIESLIRKAGVARALLACVLCGGAAAWWCACPVWLAHAATGHTCCRCRHVLSLFKRQATQAAPARRCWTAWPSFATRAARQRWPLPTTAAAQAVVWASRTCSSCWRAAAAAATRAVGACGSRLHPTS